MVYPEGVHEGTSWSSRNEIKKISRRVSSRLAESWLYVQSSRVYVPAAVCLGCVNFSFSFEHL